MWLIRRLKKLSVAQKKVENRNVAKNDMPNLLAYICGRIGAVPLILQKSICSK
jgi:hypothetical protein